MREALVVANWAGPDMGGFFAASQLYSVWNFASFGAHPDRSIPRWHSLFGMAQASRSRQIPGLIARVFLRRYSRHGESTL
jgi:hypothetical protein